MGAWHRAEPNSLQTVRAIAILRGLTGNVDIPGGDILGMNIIRSYPTLKDKLLERMRYDPLPTYSLPIMHHPMIRHLVHIN